MQGLTEEKEKREKNARIRKGKEEKIKSLVTK
jgi:hypothetical protein